MNTKIYYVVNARMPTDKAHGIQVAKMCDAFAQLGNPLELIVSSRGTGSVEGFYGLKHSVPVRRLPVLDLQFLGPIGYRLTAIQFVLGSLLYLGVKIVTGERFVIYTVDMDGFSFAPLTWLPRPVFAEMHSVKKSAPLVKNFFKRAGIIATNQLIADGLTKTFNLPEDRVRIEPNGVNETWLKNELSQQEARTKLNLPADTRFALYVGRFYAWKGLEILADAAKGSPLPIYLVGGSREEYEAVTERSGELLHFMGAKSPSEVPMWQAAADVLLLLGTKQNEDSYRYTSPMKIFEYLATRRAVVASRTPAVQSIMKEDIPFWYEPDNTTSLVAAIREASTSPEISAKIQAGHAFAAEHTWHRRAERILDFIRGEHTRSTTFLKKTLVVVGFALIVFFSSFHLFDSPETWMDEGLVTQSAIGLLHTGKAALPVAPGVYEPAWYITSGFPLTIPLAGAFDVFGVSLETARVVMLSFLLAFFSVLFLYTRRAIRGSAGWLGFFFLIFFGPIYGDGRNVLGEIPGLLCILIALLPLMRGGELTRNRALLAGAGAGLAFAAKPIFILFLPALLLACVIHHKEINLKKVFMVGVLGALIPILLWLFTQFDTVELSRVFAIYANPRDINIGNAVLANLYRFFTESQPLYFVTALFIWVTSYIVRRYRRISVALTEEALLFFSLLVLLAFIRTDGYYRYFFPAQLFALLYLPQAVWYLLGRQLPRVATALLAALLLFQMYETSFRSWTATHYDSPRTQALEQYFTNLPTEKEVFVYQAPEILIFTGAHPTYQFVRITPTLSAGAAYAPRVLSGGTPLVITPTEFFQNHTTDVFSHYSIDQVLDNYVILAPRTRAP